MSLTFLSDSEQFFTPPLQCGVLWKHEAPSGKGWSHDSTLRVLPPLGSGYTNGLMSGFGAQGWPNIEFLCALAMCCPPLSYSQLFKEERLWRWLELLCVTKPPGSDEEIQMAVRVTSESRSQKRTLKLQGTRDLNSSLQISLCDTHTPFLFFPH